MTHLLHRILRENLICKEAVLQHLIVSTCILQFTMHTMIGKSYKLLRSFGMSTLQPLLGAIVEEITHFYLKCSTTIYIHEGK